MYGSNRDALSAVLARRRGARFREIPGVWEDGDSITRLEPVLQPDRPAVHEEPPDLGVGDADGLDDILDPGRPVDRPLERGAATRGGQEVVEVAVDDDLDAVAAVRIGRGHQGAVASGHVRVSFSA